MPVWDCAPIIRVTVEWMMSACLHLNNTQDINTQQAGSGHAGRAPPVQHTGRRSKQAQTTSEYVA